MAARRERQAQLSSDVAQPVVVRPKLRSQSQLGGSKQMNIDIPDAASEQGLAIDETQDFRVGGDGGMGQVGECVQHDVALTQIAQSQFTDNKGMRQDHSGIKQVGKSLMARAKMIDPNRGIDQ